MARLDRWCSLRMRNSILCILKDGIPYFSPRRIFLPTRRARSAGYWLCGQPLLLWRKGLLFAANPRHIR